MNQAKKKILSRWKLFEHHFSEIAELARKMRIDLEEYWEGKDGK